MYFHLWSFMVGKSFNVSLRDKQADVVKGVRYNA